MGKVGRSQVESKIDDLKKHLDLFLKSNEADQNLVKANTDLLRKKEDLEESFKIQKDKELDLRRELNKANKLNNDLIARNKLLEADLKTYRESVKMIQDLKDNLEKGLVKLSPEDKKFIAE
jgi:predicted nuclease with TOPRIM domain